MNTYAGNLKKDTLSNNYFRKVLYTGKHTQLVLMSLKVGEDIGLETHYNVDQFFRFEQGQGKVVIDGETFEVKDGLAVIVPAGSEHNIINTSPSVELKLYTLYSPANHPDRTIHQTKHEAILAETKHHQ